MLVEFENVFLIGGIFLQLGAFFLKVGGKTLFWDRENQLFWELYGPLEKSNCFQRYSKNVVFLHYA